jgi:hypothetical protein
MFSFFNHVLAMRSALYSAKHAAHAASSLIYSASRGDDCFETHKKNLDILLAQSDFASIVQYLYDESRISPEFAYSWCDLHKDECYVPLWYYMMRYTARYSVGSPDKASLIWQLWLKCRIQAAMDVACCNLTQWHRSIITILDEKHAEYVHPLLERGLFSESMASDFKRVESFFRGKLAQEGAPFEDASSSESLGSSPSDSSSRSGREILRFEFPHPSWVYFCRTQLQFGMPALNFAAYDKEKVSKYFKDNRSFQRIDDDKRYFYECRKLAFDETIQLMREQYGFSD